MELKHVALFRIRFARRSFFGPSGRLRRKLAVRFVPGMSTASSPMTYAGYFIPSDFPATMEGTNLYSQGTPLDDASQ
jgi:hypothetical protein